jgi:cytochrome c oxidase accessory protein FixG
MIVAYDHKRGEPRSKYRKDEAGALPAGDCIDCFQCVKVCPTGIDIRNGTQMECVSCTACIDACNKMMIAIQKPKGLIRYASENGISDGKKLRYTGRMKFYTVVLVLLSGILALLLISRKDIDGTIIRTKGTLYQERGTDSLSNLFNIKVINKTMKNIPVTLRLEGDAKNAGKIELVGATDIHLKDEDQANGSFFVVLPRTYITNRKMKLTIGLYDGDRKITTLSTNFAGPFGKY